MDSRNLEPPKGLSGVGQSLTIIHLSNNGEEKNKNVTLEVVRLEKLTGVNFNKKDWDPTQTTQPRR